MKRPAVLLLLLCLSLLGCAPRTVDRLVEEQGQQPLPGGEILSLVKGNTLLLHSFDGDFAFFFDPSGRLFARDISTNRDSGKWDVSAEGELCLRLSAWWYGDLRCFQVLGDAARKKLHLAGASGVVEYTAEQEAGDSKQLYAAASRKGEKQRTSLRRQEASPSAPAVSEEPATGAEHVARSSAEPADTSATLAWMAKDCPGCSLAEADLGRADLIGAKLAGADLHGANLRMANLRRADLQNANLRGATLDYANLPGANLRGADLRGAVLKGANLIKADLTGAKLDGADLSDALTEGTKGLQ